jgi:hypothetical protein
MKDPINLRLQCFLFDDKHVSGDIMSPQALSIAKPRNPTH